MTVANMIIVELTSFNQEKAADRLLTNEMVIYQGRIGRIKDVNFYDGSANVKVVIEVVHQNGTETPVAQVDTIEITVPRKAIFNTVQTVAKR